MEYASLARVMAKRTCVLQYGRVICTCAALSNGDLVGREHVHGKLIVWLVINWPHGYDGLTFTGTIMAATEHVVFAADNPKSKSFFRFFFFFFFYYIYFYFI